MEIHYREVATWGVGLLALATISGWVLGRRLPRARNEIDHVSGWWAALYDDPRVKTSLVYVGCELTNGGHVEGLLRRSSAESADVLDRDITLEAPITYTPVGGDEPCLLRANSLILSAHRIEFLAITYCDQSLRAEFQARQTELLRGEVDPGEPV